MHEAAMLLPVMCAIPPSAHIEPSPRRGDIHGRLLTYAFASFHHHPICLAPGGRLLSWLHVKMVDDQSFVSRTDDGA